MILFGVMFKVYFVWRRRVKVVGEWWVWCNGGFINECEYVY